jgi:hypothetical protein
VHVHDRSGQTAANSMAQTHNVEQSSCRAFLIQASTLRILPLTVVSIVTAR